jgi:hypothetical protein
MAFDRAHAGKKRQMMAVLALNREGVPRPFRTVAACARQFAMKKTGISVHAAGRQSSSGLVL